MRGLLLLSFGVAMLLCTALTLPTAAQDSPLPTPTWSYPYGPERIPTRTPAPPSVASVAPVSPRDVAVAPPILLPATGAPVGLSVAVVAGIVLGALLRRKVQR